MKYNYSLVAVVGAALLSVNARTVLMQAPSCAGGWGNRPMPTDKKQTRAPWKTPASVN